MGFQTKGQINSLLQKSLGNNMGAAQQQMSQKVQQYTETLNGITDPIKEVNQNIADTRQGLQTAKNTKNNLKNIAKPDFKINPQKGKPFLQRLDWQYNFQTARASVDGLKPAMLEVGAGVGYKQNERLTLGIGLAVSFGLGQNWQNIKFTYEGIAARVYADWKWVYGFSFQAGYERSLRPLNRAYLPGSNTDQDNTSQPENSDNVLKAAFGGQQQAAYLGIMKRYRISSKWIGTFLAGYNFLWQQEGAKSPWLIRLGWAR